VGHTASVVAYEVGAELARGSRTNPERAVMNIVADRI
jgi:hypothetical protein